MISRILKSLFVVALAIGLLVPLTLAVAEDKPGKKDKGESRQFVFGSGDGETLTIATEGSELIITATDGDDFQTTIVDMEQIGQMVGDSVESVLEMMGDMQFQMRAGNDNSMVLAFDEEEIEVDFDAIFAEVGKVLEGAFDEMDTGDWSHHRHHRTIDEKDGAADRELDELRRELKELKAELKKLKKMQEEG
jgi:hypothetical protein